MKKLNLLLLVILTTASVLAQPLSDSAILKMSRVELGLHLLDKSRSQKAGAYVLLGVSAAAAIAGAYMLASELNNIFSEGSSSGAGMATMGLITIGAAAGGGSLLMAGAKNGGKAEMLLRKPSPNEKPGHELDMCFKYRRSARIKNSIAYTLLGVGATLNILSWNTENQNSGNTMFTIGSIAMIASVPLFISAAGDKGRASILLQTETIPFSYYSKPIGLKSVALAISL
jgi:hypothetical protein